ncbi:MAG: zf-HC2 domain-containing protein [Armatimonadetes bacterium]|nr:zf-HC2 domain-containing protein [Armatimonadota bacterium]
MKCSQVDALLERYLRNELPPKQSAAVRDHVSDCSTCRDELAFRRSLESHLDAHVPAPDGLADKVSQRIDRTPTKRPLVFGDSNMKKIAISSTVLASVLVGAALFVPRTANASTPVESFNMMRSALVLAAQRGEISISVLAKEDDSVDVSGTINGVPLPQGFPIRVDSTRDGKVCTIHVSVDVEPKDYKVIQFGATANTLEITPKGQPDKKYEIGLDPNSYLPASWTVLAKGEKGWDVKAHSDFKPSKAEKPKQTLASPIHATLIVYVGQSATITITSSGN